jgi:hypothetical protein
MLGFPEPCRKINRRISRIATIPHPPRQLVVLCARAIPGDTLEVSLPHQGQVIRCRMLTSIVAHWSPVMHALSVRSALIVAARGSMAHSGAVIGTNSLVRYG